MFDEIIYINNIENSSIRLHLHLMHKMVFKYQYRSTGTNYQKYGVSMFFFFEGNVYFYSARMHQIKAFILNFRFKESQFPQKY